jgi:hypothetical protein
MSVSRIRPALLAVALAGCWSLDQAGTASAQFAPALQNRAASASIERPSLPPIPPCRGPYVTGWVETQSSPQQWSLEETAPFCTPIVLYTCTGSQFFCEFTYEMTHAVYATQSIVGQSMKLCKACLIQPIGPGGGAIVQVSAKGFEIRGAFSVASDPGAGMVAAAVNPAANLLYGSVTNPSGTAGILVYPLNSTSPTGFLSDAGAGSTGAGVAVDKSGNVYWAFEDAHGNGYIDEFVGGNGTARRLPIELDGAAGDLLIDERGNLVVGVPASKSVRIYAPNGSLLNTFALPGVPGSLGLDEKNHFIYVADTTDQLIDQCAYPSGKLVAAITPPQIDGVQPALATITAPVPQGP